ncbi:MAG: radical SAM family heme chaperone HemW [Planctomycetota bacterium]
MPTNDLSPGPEIRDCGLYVHIPFCETKCGYCDFFSVALKGRTTGPLVERVCRELKDRVGGCDHCVRTVFFGGGTPTILPVAELARVLETVAANVEVEELAEFTVEANPATVEEEKARLLVQHGVTRVSMGAQSFDWAELAVLERLHSPDDIPSSVNVLRLAGIREINLDLIFGIPGQSLESWLRSLRRAIELGPDHIACYGLTFEPNTVLTAQMQRGRVTPCDEDLEAEMFLATIDVLGEAGYRQYEISNFARPGCESKHNLMYWRNEPYIGVGPSACGCVDGRRYKNVADVGNYIRWMDERGNGEADTENLSVEAIALEAVLMQLRLNEGLSFDSFRRMTGLNFFEVFGDAPDRFAAEGLVELDDRRMALTRNGRLVANRVMGELAGALNIDGGS